MTIFVVMIIGGLNFLLGYLLAVLFGHSEQMTPAAVPPRSPAAVDTRLTAAGMAAARASESLQNVSSPRAPNSKQGEIRPPSDFTNAVDDVVVRLCELRGRLVSACERAAIAEFCACEIELQMMLADWIPQCAALTEQMVRPMRGRQWQRDMATRLENASLSQCAQSETSLSNLRQWQTEAPSSVERTRVVHETDRVVISLEVLARDAKHLIELLATMPAI